MIIEIRAARALLGFDQLTLSDLAALWLATIQRMEASEGNVRGIVEPLSKVVRALKLAGMELIGDYESSDQGGCGVRLRTPVPSGRPN